MRSHVLALLVSTTIRMTLASHFTERSASIAHLNFNLTIPPQWTRWGDGSADWALPAKSNAWIPVKKVRGVNLGSLFIMEPWMAKDSWDDMGCGAYDSEWECNEAVGLDTMQPRWENHWNTFYQEEDFREMKRLGLNTVRIPLGFWIVDSLIGSDPFATGGMSYLKRILRWAKSSSLFVILDLHGAPGSQTIHQSFTGHTVNEAGFFETQNYQRAWDCLRNLTIMSHTDEDFSNVVMLQVLNEPLQGTGTDLTSVFYPTAQQVIRDAEKELGINCLGLFASCLTIQFMDTLWGSGDPRSNLRLPNFDNLAYDDHNYAQWMVTGANATREGYLEYLCTNTRSTAMDDSPVITGEFSISTMGGGELDPGADGAKAFFKDFAASAIVNAEKGAGWIFWSWKTELSDSSKALWGYYDAVQAGYIPSDLGLLNRDVCERFTDDGSTSWRKWSHSARTG